MELVMLAQIPLKSNFRACDGLQIIVPVVPIHSRGERRGPGAGSRSRHVSSDIGGGIYRVRGSSLPARPGSFQKSRRRNPCSEDVR